MSEPTQTTPFQPAPLDPLPSPSVALKELATAIEAGEPPDLVEIRAALGSFRAAKLDKRSQQHVIEAREDAKQGRIPDALLLRLIAKAVESTPAALEKAEPPVKKAKSPAAPVETVVERTVRPDGVGVTKVRIVPVETGAAPSFGDKPILKTDPIQVAEETIAAVEKEIQKIVDRPTVREDLGIAPQNTGEPRGLRPISAAPPTPWPGASPNKRNDEPPAFTNYSIETAGYEDDDEEIDEPPLTDEEQADVVAEMVASDAAKRSGERNAVLVAPIVAAKNGNGGTAPALDLIKAFTAPVRQTINGEADDEEHVVVYEPSEPTETPAELVGRTAELIEREHLDADLASDLYALAGRLEDADLDAGSREPLLDRVEREIERRIERAIKSSAELPEWIVRWARRERARSEQTRSAS